jgi:hypothetical protein
VRDGTRAKTALVFELGDGQLDLSETTSGRWRMQGNLMQVMVAGNRWVVFARFYIENGRLLDVHDELFSNSEFAGDC